MLHTPVCDLLGVEHPVALGGMGSVHSPPLVAAVSNAGGFGAMGCHYLDAERIRVSVAAVRERTNKPFALNFLIFDIEEEPFAAALATRPSAVAFAWPRPDQDIKVYVTRAHDAGAKVTFMAGGVPEAERAAEAGADVIIAQGSEGGGHVGWQASLALVPMVVDAVAPIPVLAAGGIADGRGLAAALSLGASGVSMGTRFTATRESLWDQAMKDKAVAAGGDETAQTRVFDIVRGAAWPAIYPGRALRNDFFAQWHGKEEALESQQKQAEAGYLASPANDFGQRVVWAGESVDLVRDIPGAREVIERIVDEAAAVLKGGAALVRG